MPKGIKEDLEDPIKRNLLNIYIVSPETLRKSVSTKVLQQKSDG